MVRRRSSSIGALTGVLLLAGALAGALAGCATPAGGGSTAEPRDAGTPTATTEPAELHAAWLDGGRMIGLVTSGSSTCIPAATEASLDGGSLSVVLEDPEGPCTRDLVPRVTLVPVPEGIDAASDLPIRVTGAYEAATTLAGVAGLAGATETDYLPSAGWTDAGGQAVLLTWGSSGCVPVVSDATATGPSEVTVTFVEPPADQVCTMDMAPRGIVLDLPGTPAADVPDELVLTGGGFDNVRVAVLGSGGE